MMKHVLAAAISSAALLLAPGALADGGPAPEPPPPPPPVYEPPPPPVYNWYTTIFAGAVFSGDLKTDIRLVDPLAEPPIDETIFLRSPLKTGYLLGWTVGYRPLGLFGSDWFTIRPEAELSFRQRNTDFEEIFSTFDLDIFDADPFENFGRPANTLSLMFNGWLDFNITESITFYGGGGIGVGWSNMPTPGPFLPSIKSTNFAWQAGGGFNFDLSDRVFVGVGYRYFKSGFDKDIRFFIDGDSPFFPFDEIIELAVPVNFDFNNRVHELMFNLGVRF